mgnify:CR=1 FL=1
MTVLPDEPITVPNGFEANDSVSPQTESSEEASITRTPESDLIESLEKQLKECQIQSENYLDQWRRTAAEFANYKKRVEREYAEATKYCNAALIARLLPVLDDLDRAFSNLPEELKGSPWIEGMMLVQRKFHSIIEQEGVQEIETEGQIFDPNLHEAVTHEPSDTVPEGHVLGEVEKGYRLNDRILRPAKVRVSAG